uniref:Tubular mastigoneme protein n=1 Tax=Ochromonas danica TaxID=2986 RepID=C4B7Q7_OCHDN|nr:tubular mastigoneme protein [Ochromonas danica]
MFQARLLVLALCFAGIMAACDNNCSGHGTCSTDDVCECYDNWGVGLSHDSGDCSDRICPYELAWVDTPDNTVAFHKYAECANRGICNRETGECQCFDGYEGKGCQRSTCPNACSGHGTCEYIEELAFGETWNDYSKQYFIEDPKTFPYHGWDNRKIRTCVCDPTYGDVDCSKRLCPYGNDVLDIQDNSIITNYQIQQIRIKAINQLQGLRTQTFALTFKSKLNETFTTYPIVFDDSDLNDFVHDVQLALLKLPNRVIDGVSVAANRDYATDYLNLNITFTGNNVQGKQNLLVVESYECSDGCTPKITGIDVQTLYNQKHSNISEVLAADYYSFECGRRGKCDYNTGLCNCFTGYTGDNCNTMTTLT